MCQFFSFVTKGSKRYYFNWDQRLKLMQDNPDELQPDSHTSICKFHALDDDKVNKYEYNPITKEFVVDQTNIKDDQPLAHKWVKKLDFSIIVKPLIIHDIVHPFKITPPTITDTHIELLRECASVGDSVSDSVWDSVGDSVGDSVSDSVWDSVGASVRASVWASVSDSVWASVSDSVSDSVGVSVRASVGAYISSFFNIPSYKYIKHQEGFNPFQCYIDLWNQGLVPSFDGKTWRLHGGEKAEILYELTV